MAVIPKWTAYNALSTHFNWNRLPYNDLSFQLTAHVITLMKILQIIFILTFRNTSNIDQIYCKTGSTMLSQSVISNTRLTPPFIKMSLWAGSVSGGSEVLVQGAHRSLGTGLEEPSL